MGSLDLHHSLSAALSLEQCLWRTSDSQGAEGVAWACLDERGQKLFKQDVKTKSGAKSICSNASIK